MGAITYTSCGKNMGRSLELVWTMLTCCVWVQTHAVNQSMYKVPDEQRLYRDLMWGYETSVRPVLNANRTVVVNFRLTLNQIIDLDERKQVLTTNVFIDQSWTDENLMWDPADYNNINTLRVHESQVWLPDTFLFNNADEGSTGFMRGMYVLLNANGTVLWPVPVKLKSACKVDIAYFPFDDQRCQWRFGSWIYSGSWIDFHSSLEEVDLLNFIDNSGWELISIHFQKNSDLHNSTSTSSSASSSTTIDDSTYHPDLLFTLHIRRRTLFYLFNIIAPCVMLSVLTLLTFWLPTTSGEKISLGLSVFLAFSMFMLLIAEEVPATSNSVPLIGIYLTTVMTMTSVSVIMAVMVINLYNRGSKAVHAPRWVRVLVLEGLSRVLGLKHDIDKLTDNIKLDKEEEAKYACVAHPPILSRRSKYRRMSRTPSPSPPTSPGTRTSTTAVYSAAQNDFRVKVTPQHHHRDEMYTRRGNCKNGRKHQNPLLPDFGGSDCCVVTPLLMMKPQKDSTTTRQKKKRKNGCSTNSINGSFSAVNGFGERMRSTVIPQITITGTEDIVGEEEWNNPVQADVVEEEKVPDSPIWIKRDSVIKRQQEEKAKKTRLAGDNNGEAESRKRTRLAGDNGEKETRKTTRLAGDNNEEVESRISTRLAGDNWEAESKTAGSYSNNNNDIEMKTIHTNNGGGGSLIRSGDTIVSESMSTGDRDKNNKSDHYHCTGGTESAAVASSNKVSSPPGGSSTGGQQSSTKKAAIPLKVADVLGTDDTPCQKKAALLARRQIVVEWQTIATVIDRLLFWIFLVGTLAAYLVILFLVPYTKPGFDEDEDGDSLLHALQRAKRHDLLVTKRI